MSFYPLTETASLLPGVVGDLEVMLHSPETVQKNATAIVCHPHPLFGGTMNNKVVTTLIRTFNDLGLHTVRFNFRGVGKSGGQYDEGRGEVDDLLAIVAYIKSIRPNDAIWLAGFSFGAYVAAKASTQIETAQLVTIAPPVPRFGFATLPPVTCPWILVQGDKDEVVPPDEVFAWAESLNPKPKIICMPGASHFFHGQLMELRRQLTDALQDSS